MSKRDNDASKAPYQPGQDHEVIARMAKGMQPPTAPPAPVPTETLYALQALSHQSAIDRMVSNGMEYSEEGFLREVSTIIKATLDIVADIMDKEGLKHELEAKADKVPFEDDAIREWRRQDELVARHYRQKANYFRLLKGQV